MAKAIKKTGITSDSANNYVVGAGIIVHNFKWDSAEESFSFDSFGATSGGTAIGLGVTLRQMEIDGVLSTPAGGDMIEETEGTMEINLLEATLDNVKKLIIAEDVIGDGTTMPIEALGVRPKGRIEVADYLKDFGHISPLSDGGYLAIIFDYAIPTEGLEFNPQDGEDNLITSTFAARSNPDLIDDASLPVTIWRLPASMFNNNEAGA